MMIDLPHVQLRGDTYRYRRRVPLHLQRALGRKEIVFGLGKRDRGFLARYGKAHALAAALLRQTNSTGPADDQTPLELRRWAGREIIQLGLDPNWAGHSDGPDDEDAETAARDVIAEGIAGRYPVDDQGRPIGITAKDAALLRALLLGNRQEADDPTLEDARRLYLKERVIGSSDQRKKELRVNRVIGHVQAALGRKNPTLSGLTKLDALAVRDHMLETINSPATVRRYLNDLKAIVAFGIDYFGLGMTVRNPFSKVTVKTDVVAKDQRHPFSPPQLQQVRTRVMSAASTDLQRIWRLLEGTGCRLAEITGLQTGDVVLDHIHPHLDIQVHEHRRLKTEASTRKVPLVGGALDAAREAKEAADAGSFLFPAYHDRSGADNASAALMKHVRWCIGDRKITVHSLRHNMRDALLAAGVEEAVRDMITGHSQGKEASRYGGEAVRLEVATRAMRKILQTD